MADHDRDEELSRRYRELAREEPPRSLDEKILAASRRAVECRPAPLVAPTGRRRWYFPVAAAAVIVLAVAVVVHMDRERPDNEFASSSGTVLQAPPPPPAEQRRAEAAKPEAPRAEEPKAMAAPRADEAARGQRRESQPVAGAPSRRESGGPVAQAPAAPAAGEEQNDVAASRAPAAEPRRDREIDAPARSQVQRAPATASLAAQTPEQWLQGIADLRRQGRDEEADRELARFRKRYPDYRLSDEMKAKVERRQ